MLRTRSIWWLQQRWKSGKTRWSVLRKKKTNIGRALDNFDDFYGSVFGTRWRSMRAAMLTEHKYMAMVNNFGDTEKTCSQLEMDGNNIFLLSNIETKFKYTNTHTHIHMNKTFRCHKFEIVGEPCQGAHGKFRNLQCT